MSEYRLHAFDLDNTLIPGSLVERAFWRLATAGHMRLADALLADLAIERDKHRLADGHLSESSGPYIGRIVAAYVDGTRDMPLSLIRRFARTLAEEDSQRVYPIMRDVLNRAKAQDMGIVAVLSGSPDHFVGPVARALGADVATGSRFHHSRGRIHPARIQEDRGYNKHVIVAGLSRRLGAIPVSAYGDSMSDFSMLHMVPHPYAVNPTPELRVEATARNWTIIDCGKE